MKIIAVAGASASGKSLFAQYLHERLPESAVLSLDNYYVNKPSDIPMEQYNFDAPNAFDFKAFHQDLEDLRSGLVIHMPQYEYGAGKRKSNTLRIHPPKYLIIEGLYVLMHASIRSALSYSFFLETPLDILLSRRVLRDMNERRATAEYSLHQYLNFTRPAFLNYVLPTKQYAQMVVTNDYQSRLDLFIDDFLSKYQF